MDKIKRYFSKDKFSGVRDLVQTGFFITTVYIGVLFSLFVSALEKGIDPVVSRPPGVEAFIPISALLSLKHFFMTGVINEIHPSGLIILFAVIFLSILVKKSFCSWVCPVGYISMFLGKIHRKLFKKGLKPNRYMDYFLRIIKYILLFFFLFTIFVMMDAVSVKAFIYSPFNIVSDIKMLKFFENITSASIAMFSAIFVLSILIENFWCRYLCPYGALLGLLSFVSPFKIRRDEKGCTSCGKCDRVCPSKIKVSNSDTVISDECFSCGRCIDECPEKNVLTLALPGKRIVLMPFFTAIIVVFVFLGSKEIAEFYGKWQNKVTTSQYTSNMIKTGIIDIKNIKNPGEFLKELDKEGKRAFMLQMMQNRKD